MKSVLAFIATLLVSAQGSQLRILYWTEAGCTGHANGEAHQAEGACLSDRDQGWEGIVPAGFSSAVYMIGGGNNTLSKQDTAMQWLYADCANCLCAVSKVEVNVPLGCIDTPDGPAGTRSIQLSGTH